MPEIDKHPHREHSKSEVGGASPERQPGDSASMRPRPDQHATVARFRRFRSLATFVSRSAIVGVWSTELGLSDKAGAHIGGQCSPGIEEGSDTQNDIGHLPNRGPEGIDPLSAGTLLSEKLQVLSIPMCRTHRALQLQMTEKREGKQTAHQPGIQTGQSPSEVNPLRRAVQQHDGNADILKGIKTLPKEEPDAACVEVPQNPTSRGGGKERAHREKVECGTAKPDCRIHHSDEAQERDHGRTVGGIHSSAKPRFSVEVQEPSTYVRCIRSLLQPTRHCAPLLWLLLLALPVGLWAQSPPTTTTATRGVVILAIEGDKTKVEISRSGGTDWDPAYVNQVLRPGNRGRTGPGCRLTLRLSDLSVMRVAERSDFTIKAPPTPDQTYSASLLHRLLYLFHRDKPGSTRIDSRTATAATRGTEFTVAVDAVTSAMTLTVLAGEGELSNAQGNTVVRAGQAGQSELSGTPRLVPRIEATHAIQWVLYYPGVLCVDDLVLPDLERNALAPSFEAYRRGDLAEAFRLYPAEDANPSPERRLYRAALLLSVGQVEPARALLQTTTRESWSLRLGAALERMVVAVTRPDTADLHPLREDSLATEALAESYIFQAGHRLEEALAAARLAATARPTFGFAWARVAELEFSFGRTGDADRALREALRLSPRNAEAHALLGFLAAAHSQGGQARAAFDQAIALDGGLANGWLGRGLIRIREGDLQGGREDLQVAASLEPQRGVLRSYLAKGWQTAGETLHATEELELAKRLDPQDPTAWLYSALLHQQHNEFNQAIRDLEQSKALNDNRAVYRSQLLLDQDRAVRGANLAGAYADSGLQDLGLAEASRAVANDYANYSAHLFLANTYDRLRDPHGINLRYETPWLSEYLVANLLAPAGAGAVSQTVSQQEYSRFFERDGIGLITETEYLSRGDWTQSAAQYGRFAHMSYAIEGSYRSERGQRPNEDLTSHFFDFQIKQELNPKDSLYLQAIYYDVKAGDLTPYYNPSQASRSARVNESQEPLLLAGYHREWSPGVHTLFLGGRLSDDLRYSNPASPNFVITLGGAGTPVALPVTTDQRYASRLEIYTAELQQIFQREAHTLIFGLRGQTGSFDARNQYLGNVIVPGLGAVPVVPTSQVDADFSRFSAYAYDHWQITPSLLGVAGLSYDRVRHPLNHRFAPVTGGEETIDQLSPKLGLIWTPRPGTTLRGAASRSLGGVSFDQSFQLEPSQIAGFNQVFRSIIPESIANANSGAEFRMGGVSIEQRITSNTWAGVTAQWLASNLERTLGALDFGFPLTSRTARQKLDYEERSLSAYVYQLIGQEWSMGARDQLTYADFDQPFLGLPASAFPPQDFGSLSVSGLLNQLRLFVQFQHPCGFFAGGDSLWSRQHNYGYSPDLPGDDFWQFNLNAGYRFPNRRAEVRVALLNLTDQDYRLSPLNVAEILPRSRTLALSLKLNF